MKSKNDKAPKVPKFAIVNDLFHGYPPKELTDLNKTELALISSGRINQHISVVWQVLMIKLKAVTL